MNKAQKIFLMFVLAALIMLVGYMDTMFVSDQTDLIVYKFYASLLTFVGCCMALHSIFLAPVEERN